MYSKQSRMLKYPFFIFLILSQQLTAGQESPHGYYIATQPLSDSINDTVTLNLKLDRTYTMTSHFIDASGKWKKSGNKIKLKPSYYFLGCFAGNNKHIVLHSKKDTLTWTNKTKVKERKIERQMSRNVGEKVNVTIQEAALVVFRRINT